ncbi:probable ribosome biogenesis protein RLP24 [Cyclospora cayetanensis]|uniref:Probable ribosome biogenesis protein RLP24 n=1 Tax=Cyclospora cayetanensis TaxID=88456 RepID=A0A6P6RTH6_9EIME|nr:probable ribosome biogenesis protein RLP24 [Cyclospora cayetanensis]
MRIERCWFCSSNVYPGHGIVFVRNDAKIFRFCRSKCHKHFKAKGNPKKFKWTKAYRKTRGKELSEDPSFEFEQRRNCPVRYDRDLVQRTVQTMRRLDAIRQRRAAVFYRNRMLNALKQQQQEAQADKLMKKHKHLLKEMDRIEQKQKPQTLRESAKQQLEDAEEEEEDEIEEELQQQEEAEEEELEEMAVDETLTRRAKHKVAQVVKH